MNVKALRAFCLVMRHGSLAGAAQELNLSQPAVSRLVSNLEYALHLTLFHRDKRTLRPTRQARVFFKEASRILSGIERLPEIAREIEAGANSQLRVVVLSRLAQSLIVPAARLFANRHPDVSLTLEMHHRRDMERWLAGRQFDLGFGPLPVEDATLTVEPLCQGHAVAVFPRDHPLAERTAVDAGELVTQPFIALTPDTLLQSQIDAIFARAGALPNEVMRTSSSVLACALAADGHGYTITDPFVARTIGETLAAVPLKPDFKMEFGTLWPAGTTPTPAASAFRNCVSAVAGKMGPLVRCDKE